MEKDIKNRIIKFRGKQVCDGKWVYGNLIIYSETDYEIEWFCDSDKRWYKSKVVPETVGQFIGLYDDSGREIYEGDIINVNGRYPKIIRYIDKYACFCMANISDLNSKYIDIDPWQQVSPGWWNNPTRYIQRIANIFDNKELLKGEKQ